MEASMVSRERGRDWWREETASHQYTHTWQGGEGDGDLKGGREAGTVVGQERGKMEMGPRR